MRGAEPTPVVALPSTSPGCFSQMEVFWKARQSKINEEKKRVLFFQLTGGIDKDYLEIKRHRAFQIRLLVEFL